MSYNHSYAGHVRHDPNARIACETQTNAHETDGYPVLIIGDAVFFPTRLQLENIRGAIDRYLAEDDINPSRDFARSEKTDAFGSAL